MPICKLRVDTSARMTTIGPMPSLGENIKRLRVGRGYQTQRAFAVALGVEQSRLSDWENNRYGLPETPNLLKIAKVLGVSVDELLAGVDPEYDAARRLSHNVTAGVVQDSTVGVEQHLSHRPDQGGPTYGAPAPTPDDRLEELETTITVACLEATTEFVERIREFFAAAGLKSPDPAARHRALPGAVDSPARDLRDRDVRRGAPEKARPVEKRRQRA